MSQINNIAKASGIFIAIVTVSTLCHWLLIQIYIIQCSPNNIYGVIRSLFTLGSPFCQFINYIQYELSKQYIIIWGTTAITLFAFLAGKLNIK